MTAYRVTAIPARYLDRVRRRAVDDFGNPIVVRRADSDSGTPLRCCLRDAGIGEEYVLIAYQPMRLPTPYAEVGPVFVHAAECGGWSGVGYPPGNVHRPQLLRAYDEAGSQVDNIIVEAVAAEAGIVDLLARPEVAFVHSRNVLAGCFMFAIDRADATAGP
jgi:hypothetical protein